MAQETAAHFANPGPLTGSGPRNHFRFGEWKIGTLLTACFAAIVLLMIVGDTIAVLQFDQIEIRASRFYQADQKSLAIMHVYLDVVTFREILTGLAQDENPREFVSQATSLRDNFLTDVARAQQALSSAPSINQEPTILNRVEAVRAALPSQVDAMLDLVKAGDWQAVRFRLSGQAPPLIGLSSSLVADVEQEVAQERAQALESIQRSQRQLYLVLPLTALLILFMAAMLGWYATRRISRPLAQLDAGARALARGEFGHKVKVEGDDEFADLGRAFNYAADQLHKLYDAIRHSESYLAEAQKLSHTGSWAWSPVTDNTYYSDECYRLLGFAPRDGTPPPLEAIIQRIHPDDQARCREQVEKGIRDKADFELDYRIVHPDKSVRDIHCVSHPFLDRSGELLELIGTVIDITERKRAEEALRALSRDLQESKAKLEEAQRITHVGYWDRDLTTDRITWSDETYRIYGLQPQEHPMDLSALREKIHPEDRELVFRSLAVALAGGPRYNIEYRVLRPTGEVRIVHSNGDVKRDASGRSYQMFGTVQDITDRKRAEEALGRNQFYLSEGQRLAHMGSWAFNPSGFFDYWSYELFQIYGLDPQQGAPTLERYLAALHPQDRESMAETIKMMHVKRCGCDVKKRILRPGGELRYVRCVGIPVIENEVLKGFLGTAVDITDQEVLTQELERQQAHLTEAQALTHTGSWVWRVTDRSAVHLSEEWYRIYGFDPAEGAPTWEELLERIHPEDRPKWTDEVERAIVKKIDYSHEFRILLPNGKAKWIHTVGHPVLSNIGDLEGFVGSSTDISERKSAEQEHEKLHQLEADLAHTNRVSMLGELAASLAHEIKQPLAAAITSANSCIEWLAHEPPNLDRARAAATRIDKYGNRAAEIIDHIRSLYRRSPSQRDLVDVNEIIHEIFTLLQDEATQYSIVMRSELAAELPKIKADRVQLQQVFMNLMLNAIEALRDSGGELTVRSQLQEGQLTFSVSDTGPGLPTENIDQIFSAFFTTKPHGSGMGLAISRTIVESHGGRLWATANNGRGATFHFTLPTA